jgi:hypothetical protein
MSRLNAIWELLKAAAAKTTPAAEPSAAVGAIMTIVNNLDIRLTSCKLFWWCQETEETPYALRPASLPPNAIDARAHSLRRTHTRTAPLRHARSRWPDHAHISTRARTMRSAHPAGPNDSLANAS